MRLTSTKLESRLSVRGRLSVLILSFALVFIVALPSAQAKNKSLIDKVFDGAIDGAASFAAELALNAIASGLFLGYCGEDTASDDAGEFICSVIGDVSGDNDAQWREGVNEKLDEIDKHLQEVIEGQTAIEESLETQFSWIRTLIEELPERARVHDDMANIDAGWAEFMDMFDDVRGLGPKETRVRIREVSQSLLTNPKFNVAASAKDLKVAIQTGHAGLPPLPMMLAQEISRRIRVPMKDPQFWDVSDPTDFDIRPHYVQMELALQKWMLRQRQAQVMTLFAKRALSDNGEIESKDVSDNYTKGIEQQLESFQRAVEWLTLHHSFPLSPFGNFLPTGALEVFQRADAIQAVYLASAANTDNKYGGQAILGRIVAMGNSGGETMQVVAPGSTTVISLKGVAHKIPLIKGQVLDWWVASDTSKPESYDVVDFANFWTVYRYKISPKMLKEGNYQLKPAAAHWPVLPTTVAVDNSLSDLTGTKTMFGSFSGISRAGGGYALFSGDYKEKQVNKLNPYMNKRSLGPAKPLSKYAELTTDNRIIDRSRGSMPLVSLVERGRTIGVPMQNNRFINIPFELVRDSRITLTNGKLVRPAKGNTKLMFNVRWSNKDLGVGDVGAPADRVLQTENDFDHKFLQSKGQAKYYVGFLLGFGDRKNHNPLQGITLSEGGDNEKPISVHQTRTDRHHDQAEISFGSKGYPLEINARTMLEFTRQGEIRNWTMVARGAIQTAYFTPIAK